MLDIVVRAMVVADLPQVQVIETMCFKTPWCREHFLHELQSSLAFPLVALAPDDVLAGYICPMLVVDEGQVLNIAVHGNFQRQGIGRYLLRAALDEFHRRQATYVSLEVRVSNNSAITLYEQCGFRKIGTRTRYYPDGEDAVLMEFDMKQYEE